MKPCGCKPNAHTNKCLESVWLMIEKLAMDLAVAGMSLAAGARALGCLDEPEQFKIGAALLAAAIPTVQAAVVKSCLGIGEDPLPSLAKNMERLSRTFGPSMN